MMEEEEGRRGEEEGEESYFVMVYLYEIPQA